MKKRDLITAAAGALAATALAGGIAVAAIPDAGGTIYGCYQKKSGQLRVLDRDVGSCGASELPISWNTEGPSGVQGPQGEQGPQGLQGPPGADGRDGVDGRDGIDGADGADGTDGTDGVSVTSASEPPGPNCATGGSQFTAANGVTYACNGEDGASAGALEGYEIVQSVSLFGGASAVCPEGKVVIGGGALVGYDHYLSLSAPFKPGDGSQTRYGWNAQAHWEDPSQPVNQVTVTARAICVNAP